MKLLLLPGDGIGPAISDATQSVLRSVGGALQLNLEIEQHDIGFASLASEQTTLPARVLQRIHEVDGVILGPVSHSDYPARSEGGINPSAELRRTLDLYANIRPCRSCPF